MTRSFYPVINFAVCALMSCSSTPSESVGSAGNTAAAGSGGAGGTAPTAGTSPIGATGGGGPTGTSGTGTGGGPVGGSSAVGGSGATGSATGATGSSGGSTSVAGAGGSAGQAVAGAGGGTATGGMAATGGAAGGGGDGGLSGGAGTSGGSAGAMKFIGNIAPKNQSIPADFADKWMQMSMEANSKWGFVQPNGPNDWVWGPVDEAYAYAKEHGIIFKQHTFFWNFEQPSWVNNSNVAAAGEAWVKAFCERYPDVPMIDVVNEPMHNPAPYREGMGGAGVSGYDWVVNAFKWAKQHCPNSILILNDFNIIEWPNDHADFLTSLQAMLDAGAPIDAIGAQGHDVYRAGTDVAKGYLDVLTERFNLPIYVTELDIDLANDQEQLAKMQEEIEMLWAHPNVHGITYWGFLQGSTWRTNAWLVSTSGTQRPAMVWLQEFIAAHR